MKGVIFNVVHEVVVDLYDESTWDDLLDAAGVDGAYTALGNYDDSELLSIVAAACEATGLDTHDLLQTVGRKALPKLVDRMPSAAEPFDDPIRFLCSVNEIIHPEVRKLYPDAKPPIFTFTEQANDDGAVDVLYESARRLDALAEGLILGCGDYFNQPLDVIRIEPERTDGAMFRVSPSALT